MSQKTIHDINPMVRMLNSGKVPYGVFVNDLSVHNGIQIAKQGADFVILDFEHCALDVGGMRQFFMSMVNRRALHDAPSLELLIAPLVRIPSPGRLDPSVHVKQALDSGACGVVFPMIESASQAQRAINSMRYHRSDERIQGARSVGPKFALWHWGVSLAEYYALAELWPINPNGQLLAVCQIESKKGVEYLDEILQVEGIGAIMLGPLDLVVNQEGCVEVHSEKNRTTIEYVSETCKKSGVKTMIVTGKSSYLWYKSLGFDICIAGFDGGIHEDAYWVMQNR